MDRKHLLLSFFLIMVFAGDSFADLLVCYKFEETSGTIANNSANSSFKGILKGGLRFGPSSVPGHTGKGLYFDGKDDHITIGTPLTNPTPPPDYILNNLTIALWLKTDGEQSPYAGLVFRKEGIVWAGLNVTSIYGHNLGYHWTREHYVDLGGQRQYQLVVEYNVESHLCVPDNQWTFAAMVVEPKRITLYLNNGVELDSAEFYPPADSNYAQLLIPGHIGTAPGQPADWQRFFKGVMDEIQIYDDSLSYSEIRVLAEAPTNIAGLPVPLDGEKNLDCETTLVWEPGFNRETLVPHRWHDIYFGTNAEWVKAATSSGFFTEYKGRQEANVYDTGLLEYNKTYYWRIDEVNSTGEVYKGNVWSFTTIAYEIMDDFESYVSNENLSAKWHDAGHYVAGLGYEESVAEDEVLIEAGCPKAGPTAMAVAGGRASNVGTSGSSILLGRDWGVTHEGICMMRYSFDNRGLYGRDYYSEIEYVYARGEDWTVRGIAGLTLYFCGEPVNVAERMYVALTDVCGNTAVVPYPGDANNIKIPVWQEWNISFDQFPGINLDYVKKLSIGFGDRNNLNPGGARGGTGLVYFDSIRFYVPRCMPGLSVAGDFNGDCAVNAADLEVLRNDWLLTDYNASMLVWYKFDETSGTIAHDSAGPFDATVSTDSAWDGDFGKIGGSLNFDGNVGVTVPARALTAIDDSQEITITVWLYGRNQPHKVQDFLFQGGDVANYALVAHCPLPDGRIFWRAESTIDTRLIWFDQLYWPLLNDPLPAINPANWDGRWNHYAFTKNAKTAEMSIYLNGKRMMRLLSAFRPIGGWKAFLIGRRMEDNRYKYHGWMDDFRIYDKMLTRLEIQSILNGSQGIVKPKTYDISSPANVYDEEPALSRAVDFRDFTVLADTWLEEKLWP